MSYKPHGLAPPRGLVACMRNLAVGLIAVGWILVCAADVITTVQPGSSTQPSGTAVQPGSTGTTVQPGNAQPGTTVQPVQPGATSSPGGNVDGTGFSVMPRRPDVTGETPQPVSPAPMPQAPVVPSNPEFSSPPAVQPMPNSGFPSISPTPIIISPPAVPGS